MWSNRPQALNRPGEERARGSAESPEPAGLGTAGPEHAAAPEQAPPWGQPARNQPAGGGYEWPSSAVSSSPVVGTEPESRDGRSGKGSTRVSSITGAGGWGGLGMTAASEWPPQP